MSRREYDAALARAGFRPTGFMGYYHLPEPCANVSVCSLNGGDRLRDRLAYLLAEAERHAAQPAAPEGKP